MTGLGAAALPIASGASVLFCYAVSLSCYLLPAWPGLGVAALAAATFAAAGARLGGTYLAFNGVVMIAVAGIAVSARRTDAMRRDLRRREEEVVELTRVAERQRIARDLHDRLGQTLTLATLEAELAARAEPLQADVLRRLAGLAREALGLMRGAVQGYGATPLVAEAERAAASLHRAGLDVTVIGSPSTSLPPAEEAMAAMILAEAVTNVIRHAGACAARLHFGDRPGLIFRVEDDGRGATRYAGFGIEGMHQRAARIGAVLTVGAGERDGTVVVLELA